MNVLKGIATLFGGIAVAAVSLAVVVAVWALPTVFVVAVAYYTLHFLGVL